MVCGSFQTSGTRKLASRSVSIHFQAVPFLLVVGDREVENGEVAVRTQSGEDLGTMPVDSFATLLQNAPTACSREEIQARYRTRTHLS